QNIIPMENSSSALKLTTASYWRPSEKNIHRFPDAKDEDEWGVKPNKDYEVKLGDEERLEYYKWRRERDIVRRPGQGPPKAKDGEKEKKTKEFTDRVLDKAVEYLRGEIRRAGGAAPAPNGGAQLRPGPGAEAPQAARASLEFRSRSEFIGNEHLR